MEPREWLLMGIATAVFIVSIFILFVVIKQQAKKVALPDVTDLIACFGTDNIQHVTFVRHKINVTVASVIETDMVKLKAFGAVGINLVGNRIKFYFEHDNEKIFEALQSNLNEAV